MIFNNGCPFQWLVFPVMDNRIALNYYFACKRTKCAFRNDGTEKNLAVKIEAWDFDGQQGNIGQLVSL